MLVSLTRGKMSLVHHADSDGWGRIGKSVFDL